MQQVRCTNCGSTAIIPDESGAFCKCEACGSTFNVPKAAAFSKVELDHTQDVKAWREYLAKQLRLQQESNKARDYAGVKLFAQKILSVLPDDFCAQYYVALADRFDDNDTEFSYFLAHSDLAAVTPEERKEVADSLVLTAEPKYADEIKAFIARAYPTAHESFDAALERSIRSYIQKLHLSKTAERDVFICHRTAAPDQDIADAICTRLEERGLRCWIAPRNILAGSQNYERDILKGVENCKIFLFVSSFKSIYSEDCEMELKAAVLADKALYSYRIDDAEYDGAFKRALSPVQWLDGRDDPYAHLEQLVIDIKGMLAESEREKVALEEKRLEARERERRIAEQQRAREQERLDRLEKIVSGGVVAAPVYNTRSRLKRAEIEISSGNFSRAENIVDGVLDDDPENPLAWWLLLLCDYRARSDGELAALDLDFTVNANYINAERFADEAFLRRIDDATSAYRVKIIKTTDELLNKAERLYGEERFDELSATLDKCADAFSDENGLIFKKFPDIASRYFWLRLWAKYGQTSLVCVEDITRESEYKSALKYASPAQTAEYARARETVSKNAQNFLRERCKNRGNDGKLADYLVDNKNILPIDTYNYYSSMLYYRKMLDQLNMTESQLVKTSIDISTNEYFMLAQSLATADQKRAYDELAATLDSNRENKMRREREERERRVRQEKRAETRNIVISTFERCFIIVFAAISYILFATFAILWLCSFDVSDLTLSAYILSMGAAVCRMIDDIAILVVGNPQKPETFSRINMGMSIASFPMTLISFEHLSMLPAVIVCSIITLVLEGIAIRRSENAKKEK